MKKTLFFNMKLYLKSHVFVSDLSKHGILFKLNIIPTIS